MITKNEAANIEEYLKGVYSLTDEESHYLEQADSLIYSCMYNKKEAKRNSEKLLYMADELYNYMSDIFSMDCGVSPRLLQYQERYYQLLLLYAQANELQGMYLDSLSLLCFTSAFDLYYLQEIKKSCG